MEPSPALAAPPTELTYWVNSENKFTRHDISPDYKDIRVGQQFDVETGYGDIAVSKDGKFLYGIQFVGSGGLNNFTIDKYDAFTGERAGRGSFSLGVGAAGGWHTSGAQLNALTFDYDGHLLFSTPKTNTIWKLNPSCMVKSTRVVYLPFRYNRQHYDLRDRHEPGIGAGSCDLLSGVAGVDDVGVHHGLRLVQGRQRHVALLLDPSHSCCSVSTAPTRRTMASRLGKIPTMSVRRRISRFNRSVGLFDQTFVHTAFGAWVNASSSSRASSR